MRNEEKKPPRRKKTFRVRYRRFTRRRHIGANLHQWKFQSYGIPRETNVGFSPHYVKYAYPLYRVWWGSESQLRLFFLKNVTQNWSWCKLAPVCLRRRVSSYLLQISWNYFFLVLVLQFMHSLCASSFCMNNYWFIFLKSIKIYFPVNSWIWVFLRPEMLFPVNYIMMKNKVWFS